MFLQFPSLHHRIQPRQDESIWRKTTKTSPMPFRTDPLRLVKNQKEGFLPPLEEFQGGSHGCIHCRRSRELPFHRHPRSHKFATRLHSLSRSSLFRTKPETFSHPTRVPQSRKREILHVPTLLFCYIPAFCQQCSFAHARRPLNKKYASPLGILWTSQVPLELRQDHFASGKVFGCPSVSKACNLGHCFS